LEDKVINTPLNFSFSNLDLYAFNNLAKEWDLDFIKLEAGQFSGTLFQVIDPDFQIGYANFNLKVKQEGKSPPGVWTFAFVIDPHIFWRNYIVQPESIIIYAPNSEINTVSSAGFDVVTFSITEDHLLKIARQVDYPDIVNELRNAEVLITQGPEWKQIRKRLSTELDHFRSVSQNKTIHENKVFLLNELTPQLVKLMLKSKNSTQKVSNKSRLQLLSNVEKIMLGNLTENFTIQEIIEKVETSERTLLYAFKKRFGIGAKAYLKILKLNTVYHVLRQGITESSIAKIARESGFWHLGQFSKDYKNFYGELPTETLFKNSKVEI
jgi:AraC family transcriptional regulator, ethanolamine operon transcriptional activator